jgi:hypothetical protein
MRAQGASRAKGIERLGWRVGEIIPEEKGVPLSPLGGSSGKFGTSLIGIFPTTGRSPQKSIAVVVAQSCCVTLRLFLTSGRALPDS